MTTTSTRPVGMAAGRRRKALAGFTFRLALVGILIIGAALFLSDPSRRL